MSVADVYQNFSLLNVNSTVAFQEKVIAMHKTQLDEYFIKYHRV